MAPRPVIMPSYFDPETGQPRPVNPPAYNPQPQLQDNYNQWETEQGGADAYYTDWMRGTLGTRQADQAGWESAVGGQVAQLPGITQQQGAARAGNTAGLRSAYEGYNASDLAATNNFVNTNNQNLGVYNQRANDLYNTQVPMLTASQWSSNPQDLANQNQALGNFNSIYGGSLDYQAAQAQQTQAKYETAAYINAQQTLAKLKQYASDPSDVKRQKDAIEQLRGMVDGGEWHDSLADARDKYKGLTDPEVTAQERFIMENFRQTREDQERASREGVLANLGARGLRSGAAEQTAMLQSQQELGRQGVLEELGAQANAIGRSQQALEGYANTSAMGRQSQLQAMGMYIDAAGNLRSMNDTVGMYNTREANANEQFNAGQANNISMFNADAYNQNSQFNANAFNQNSQFNAGQANYISAYNAGQTNDASANNQRTRLGGAEGYANQANQIRFDNDAVGTFNTGQQNLVGMNNQQVQLDDLTRRGNQAQGQLYNNTATGQVNLDAIKGTNAGNAGRDTTIHGAQQGDIDSFAGNQRGDVAAFVGYEDQKLDNRNAVTDAFAGVGTGLYGGVFTPSATAKKANKDAIAGNNFYLDPNRKYG